MAELGRRALEGIDVGSLMQEVADKLAETLEVEYVKVLELCPDGDRLLLRAGVGWREGLVGYATEEAGRGSHSGYTLLAEEPVILDDLSTEARFEAPPLLREHGVTSGVTTLIRGQKWPFGVLAVHSRERRIFTEDDVNLLRAGSQHARIRYRACPGRGGTQSERGALPLVGAELL
jgi:GAF domain-containing protein